MFEISHHHLRFALLAAAAFVGAMMLASGAGAAGNGDGRGVEPAPPQLAAAGPGAPGVTPPGAGGSDRRNGNPTAHSRAVCAEHGAHCTVEVATDEAGIPVVSQTPAASTTVTGFGPAAFHSAYYLPWNSTVRQTIAVIDAFDHPNVKADLDTYDAAYGLGAFPSCSATVTTACFQRVDQNGNTNGFANGNPSMAKGWDLETNLDVQIAHATCLNCKILLVEAYNESGLAEANNTAARLGATEISNSWGFLEGTFSTWNPSAFNHAGIAITASAHDHGYGAYYPADLNTVVAVGGTRLSVTSSGAYASESVWGNGTVAPGGSGTGSGCSTLVSSYTSAPYWQKTVANWAYTGCGSQRAIADVSADADTASGAWVYNSAPDQYGQTGWFSVGGTSLSAPIIAGVFALAGNAAQFTWPGQMLYKYPNQFHDVTSGTNGTCTYTIMCNGWSGYDGPTGVGTPWGTGGF